MKQLAPGTSPQIAHFEASLGDVLSAWQNIVTNVNKGVGYSLVDILAGGAWLDIPYRAVSKTSVHHACHCKTLLISLPGAKCRWKISRLADSSLGLLSEILLVNDYEDSIGVSSVSSPDFEVSTPLLMQ